MRLELPPARKKRLVSMTPLIDVVFILLLFFMLASNFQQWRAMPFDLAAQNSIPAEPNPIFSVHIGHNGGLTLDDTPVNLEKLTEILQARISEGTAPSVLIDSHEATDLQTLVQVIDSVSAAGVDQITFGGTNP
jgi:biopolymer transport protein ExbD